ncbi:MAG: aminotransferase class IV [Nitrospirae bacterium]|nr:aminotransferase class IV [Nitrospirota bacterium]
MIYLNTGIVPKNKALIPVFDHGFLYGDGIYETMRAYKGVVFRLEEHIERLFRSAAMISLKIPKAPGEIKQAVYETIKANGHMEAVIRLTVSRGAGPIGLDPGLCPVPTFVIISGEFRKYPVRHYRNGVKIAIVNTRRNFRGALDPRIKSLNFLNGILAKIEAKNRGAFEAVMLDYRGYLAEGSISNIFFVKDGTLCTPSVEVGILDGITRKIIIDCAKEAGIKVVEGRFRKEDVYNAEEVFISNTTMEVMPAAEVDEVKMPAQGEMARALHKAYKRKVAEYIRTPRHTHIPGTSSLKDLSF